MLYAIRFVLFDRLSIIEYLEDENKEKLKSCAS